MDIFPIEIWTQIFGNLRGRDWLALCTTCHVLSTISRTNLYDTVTVTRGLGVMANEEKIHRRMRLFERSIAEQPELTRLVRTLRLFSLGIQRPIIFDTYSSHPILRQLASFSGLKALELQGFLIDSDCYTAIHTLKLLQRVGVTLCMTDSTLSGRLLSPISPSSISEISISYPKSVEGWTAITHPGLQSLRISDTPAGHVVDLILPKFVARGVNESLTKLEWTGYITAALIQFLECCPKIGFLSLPQGVSFQHSNHVGTISRNALPMLAHFSGPAEYIEVFIKDRPVCCVILDVYSDTHVEVLDALRLSKRCVTRMALVFHGAPGIKREMLLLRAPATLHYLRWNELVSQENTELWMQALSRMKYLRVLELEEVVGASVVDAFRETCPSLRQVTYRDLSVQGGKSDGENA